MTYALSMKSNLVVRATSISDFFRAYREVNELTQRDLAERLGVHSPTIAQIESRTLRRSLKVIARLWRHLSYSEKVRLGELLAQDFIAEIEETIRKERF